MKKFILLLLMSIPVYSQMVITGGADFFFTSSSGLDKFVEKYNQTRSSILTKKMESLGTMVGWSANLGFASGIAFDLGYSFHSGQMRAETNPATTSGGTSFREVDIKVSNFLLGTGAVVANDQNMALIFPYIEADIQTLSFETRTNTQSRSGDVGLIANMGIGGKLFIGIGSGLALMIHPSYNFGLMDVNFNELYEKTSTSYDFLSDDTKGSFGGFHIRVGLGLLIND
ncbi:hypothetical protein MASR1M107_30100 [Ignavibacteriales bacterium]